MKKNVMMRLACFLLVAVLISTSAISGTYAKYVTADDADDSARVAKWGVTVDVTADAFSDAYKDEAVTYTSDEEVMTITVQADSKDTKVLAPGTEGTLATVVLDGTPEVDVEVTFAAELTLTGWLDKNGNVYCPIVFTVGSEEMKWDNSYATVADFAAAVSKKINDNTAYYHTNTDLGEVAGHDLVITWEWPFETGADDVEKAANNVKDTFLGDEAAANRESTIAIDLAVTVTQVN